MAAKPLLPFHPLADLFPLIEGAEFAELVADIAANGLRVPIVTIEGENGPVILDGRNRYRACVEAGVEPRFEQYEGDDPAGFVASSNLLRRHLSTHDRQVLAGKFAALPHGTNQHGGDANLRLLGSTPAMTVERAAEVFGVSPRTVDNARKVEQKGSPTLKERFKAGDVAVSTAAEIAKAPAPVQEAIAAMPTEAIKVAAKVIKKDPEVVKQLPAKLVEDIGRLAVAEAEAAERRKTLPTKAEALEKSKETGGWVRARDGKDYIHVEPEDREKIKVWLWFRSSLDNFTEPQNRPPEVIRSMEPFWVNKLPGLIDSAIAYLTEVKAELEKVHGAPKAPEVIMLPVRDALPPLIEAPEPAGDNVIPLGDRLKPIVTERQVEREAEAEQAKEDELDLDDFDDSDPLSCAAVVAQSITMIAATETTGKSYWMLHDGKPARGEYYRGALKAKETILEIVASYVPQPGGRK